MNEQDTATYKRHRFPPAIIGHAVWRYFRFARSDREVEELLAERGVIVTYETVRPWCRTFGQADANERCRRRSRPGDAWPLDAVFSSSNGAQHDRWRAVDLDGTVLASLVPSRRDAAAARKCFRKLLKRLADVLRVVSTDTLARYGTAKRPSPASSTGSTGGSTTARSMRTSRPASGNGGCGASSVRGTRSGSSLPTARSPATSAHVASA